MKHVDRALEAHRVDSTVWVARVGRNDFEDGPAAEPLQGLYARVFFTPLSGIKSLPNIASHGRWEAPEIPSGRPYPPNGLRLPFPFIPVYVYEYILSTSIDDTNIDEQPIFCREIKAGHI